MGLLISVPAAPHCGEEERKSLFRGNVLSFIVGGDSRNRKRTDLTLSHFEDPLTTLHQISASSGQMDITQCRPPESYSKHVGSHCELKPDKKGHNSVQIQCRSYEYCITDSVPG